jgi:hypothetical protein
MQNAGNLAPEEKVRQRVIAELRKLGWAENRLQWKPEWQVPATPHDLTKRERNQRFTPCGSADLVAFADDSGEAYALQVIFEFKEPTIEKGRMQLMRYLASEPVARMGFWTNGTNTLAVYKSHTNDWVYVEDAPYPAPHDDLTQPPDEPPVWNDLRTPTEAELSATLRRLVATTVITDSRSTRREDQMRELLHLILVKVEADSLAALQPDKAHPFRIYGDSATMVSATASIMRDRYRTYFLTQRERVFHDDDRDEILLADETIFNVVVALWPWRLLGDEVSILAKAFQVFRTSALKSGEGQFLTPLRVIRPSIKLLEITSEDKVIDPACGTGGFVIEALRQVQENEFPSDADSWRLVKFANDRLYAVDMDPLGTKLTRALMIAARDGSTHVLMGDAVRSNQWKAKYSDLYTNLMHRGEISASFTVVVTNPPFGEDLKVSAADARSGGYSIAKAAAMGGKREYVDLEIGLIYLELAHKLLQVGGRVGIVLPETYFFSFKYRWLAGWLQGRFRLRGMFNIAMEAFEEFCRAKTNFYVFEKIGDEPTEANEATKAATTTNEEAGS